MGLLDAMFGGGVKLELQLDAARVPEGGLVGGRVRIQGGKKPLRIDALKVQLFLVSVQTREGSAVPDIDMRVLSDQTIAANNDLPPGSQNTFDFRFSLPAGLTPSAHNVSYKVRAVADIPGVKDPSDDAKLEIADSGGFTSETLNADQIFARWPALNGKDEDALWSALHDMLCASYSEAESMLAAEPVLARLIREASPRIRAQALETWGNLLNNRARRDHLKLLDELANDEGLPLSVRSEVIKASAKFAEEGALPLLERFVHASDAETRKEAVDCIRFHSDEFKGKKKLLLTMTEDPDAAVRASACGALSAMIGDENVFKAVVARLEGDTDANVQAACIGAINLAHHHYPPERALSVYERHLTNPNPEVRIEIGRSIHWAPAGESARVRTIVERLLADNDEEVRASMAWQFKNLGDFKELAPLAVRAAETDPSEKVRRDAFGSLGSMMSADELVPYYRSRLASEPTESVCWGVLSGLRDHSDHPQARAVLEEIARSRFEDVAGAAREALEG